MRIDEILALLIDSALPPAYTCHRRVAAEPRCSVLFCSVAVLDPKVGHTMDVLYPFFHVLCHSD